MAAKFFTMWALARKNLAWSAGYALFGWSVAWHPKETMVRAEVEPRTSGLRVRRYWPLQHFKFSALTLIPLSQLRTTLTLASYEGFPSLSHSCTTSGIGILVSLYTDSGWKYVETKLSQNVNDRTIMWQRWNIHCLFITRLPTLKRQQTDRLCW